MQWLNDSRIKALTELRQTLHRHPELSEQEFGTSRQILDWLERHPPDRVIHPLGPTGIAAVYEGKEPGPTVVFRCELDALAIPETITPPYASLNEGISHKCGHDGHMSVMAGMAWLLSDHRPDRGRAVLVFQPAEETGTGARGVIANDAFRALAPDFVFGFHNVPGYPMHRILWRDETFAAASVGVLVQFRGMTSHSSYPEFGRSPARAMSELLIRSLDLPARPGKFEDQVWVTPVNAVLGEAGPNYGIAPGVADIRITLRALLQKDLDHLKEALSGLARELAERDSLKFTVSLHEEFPATVNHSTEVRRLVSAASLEGLDCGEIETPFRWSEDFCFFTRDYPGAFFGIGAGETQPQLHHQHYDFPDELIATGIRIYARLADDIVGLSGLGQER